MFDYVFLRAHASRVRAGDPFPLIGALVVWALFVAAPLVPLLGSVPRMDVKWIPLVVREHNALTGMCLMAAIYVVGIHRYFRKGEVARLERLFEADRRSQRRPRQLFLWVWPVSMFVLTLLASWPSKGS